MNLAQKLSQYALDLSYSDFPSDVIHQAKRHFLDALACALGAFRSPLGWAPVKKVAQRVTDSKGATLLGTDHRTTPDLAAFHNGTLIRYLDYNDTYLSKEPAHPSDNISAALAMAESLHRSGKDLITAIVLAYEIQCRLCDAASIRSRGWDHVTYGLFSSALAAGKMLKLSSSQMENALGIAGVAHVAMRQTRVGELSMWKGAAFANAARNGVFSVLLAKEGMTGPRPIFEGEMGFFQLISGPLKILHWGGVNDDFMIQSVYLKYFPAEYHAQGAIEAALHLRPEISKIEDIQKISIKTFKAAVEIIGGEPEKWHPHARETADHSLPYCVAVAFMDGKVGLKQFSLRRIQDRRLQDFIQKVTVEEIPQLTKMYPRCLPVTLDITLKSGKVLSKTLNLPKGHAGRPLSDCEIQQKFKNMAEGLLSVGRQEKILDEIWNLEKVKNIRSLVQMFELKKR